MTVLAGCRVDHNGRLAYNGVAQNGTVRHTLLINDHWRFIRTDIPEASAAIFDDSRWESVTLPHTWNVQDGTDGGNNYYRGAAWYRRAIDASDSDLEAGERFYLRFGAASQVARVFVNGASVGEHRGGFSAFCFDVTDQLHAGRNEIAVRVDNSRADDVAPQSGDFTVFGGLYRDVELLVLAPIHISPVDDASSGVYLRQASVSAESATIDVTTKLENKGLESSTVDVEVTIVPARAKSLDGGVKTTTRVTIPAQGNVDASAEIVLRSPKLWSGVAAPNLYAASVVIRNTEGRELDSVTQPLGLRAIGMDLEKGLLLNGQHYAAHGVNVHQEVANKGWAGSFDDYALNYKLIRELGATCVRMAHYQHNEIEYSLCDKNGLAVWSEIPLVNEFGKSPAFRDNLKQQLRELIKQNYNHPSIVVWGLWNELAPPPEDANWSMVNELAELAHELDPSRPTTAAHHLSAKSPVVNIPDVIAFNRYTGWYGGDARDWPKTLDTARHDATTRPIAISEYGAGASIHQHELKPSPVEAGGPWHPEEYQSLVHENAYRAMKARSDLWATFLWSMFDFSADQRNEGDHAGRNDKGLVTYDRKTKKDAFYFYQANWTTTPMVHITSARYEPYPIGKSDVKIYSNCDDVELFIDGKSQGNQKGNDGVFIWPAIDFVEGSVTLRAVAMKDGATVTDEVIHQASHEASTRTTPLKQPATRPATTRASH